MTPETDILQEARRLLALAEASDVPMRVLGGVAVMLRAGDGLPSELSRPVGDIDFATLARQDRRVESLFTDAGYEPNPRFNTVHGKRRLVFYDTQNARQVDVFVGVFEMCHEIPLDGRVLLDPSTLPLAELLLTKLQIVSLNPKDLNDIYALLATHEVGDRDGTTINAAHLARVCARDWGLWKTVTLNLDRLHTRVGQVGLAESHSDTIDRRLQELRATIEREPKSTKWRLRSRIGTRVAWYEDPDEIGHVAPAHNGSSD